MSHKTGLTNRIVSTVFLISLLGIFSILLTACELGEQTTKEIVDMAMTEESVLLTQTALASKPSPTPSPSPQAASPKSVSLYPDQALSKYGFNSGSDAEIIITHATEQGLMLLFTNSNGSSSPLMEFNFAKQKTLEEWEAENASWMEKIEAILTIKRTPESIQNGQQVEIYALDMETYMQGGSSLLPRVPNIPVIQMELKPDIPVDVINVSEIVRKALEFKVSPLYLVISTPRGTQMVSGEEIAWETLDSDGQQPTLVITFEYTPNE